MKITYLKFSEYSGREREWTLDGFDVGDVNLLVGRNASGKTRLLNVIAGFARLISGKQRSLYDTADYLVRLSGRDGDFEYRLVIDEFKVKEESLKLNNRVLFSRDQEGAGKIFGEKAGVEFDISIPTDVLVIGSRRDKIQHPFLEGIYEWASTLRHYRFANSFGQEHHALIPQLLSRDPNEDAAYEVGKIHEIYSRGYDLYGDDFDKAILQDFAKMGYECTDVGAEQLNLAELKGLPLATLYVREVGLPVNTIQAFMSQGMFRALALVIELNYVVRKLPAITVLVDDVGEGLDFERSKAFVALLKEKASDGKMQLIMTTNDRFVMNGVPLSEWGVVQRTGCHVRVINERNSAQVFEEFRLLGLNNFDFFADRFFEQEA